MQLTTKPSVLIVDDAPDNLMLIKMLLQGRCQVQQAGNGMQALLLARNPPYPDLILLDVLMPEMDGYAVCAELKANPTTRDIPVIFLTSRNQVQDQQRGFQSGAVDYITKPIDPAVLQARVSTHLHLKELRVLLKQQDMQMPHITQEIIRLQYFLAALARRMQTKGKFADSIITQLFHATALYSTMPQAASATDLPSIRPSKPFCALRMRCMLANSKNLMVQASRMVCVVSAFLLLLAYCMSPRPMPSSVRASLSSLR